MSSKRFKATFFAILAALVIMTIGAYFASTDPAEG